MQKKIEKKTFSDFYEPNINWMDEPGLNVISLLSSFYPNYFQGNKCDYEKIKIDILNSPKKKPTNKAHEVFRALFKMPFKATNGVASLELTQIESEFGHEIFAHGVEEEKGGMYNLLLMCISNQVRAPSNYWGFFVSGIPNISPVPHGPYYLIYGMPNQSLPPPNNPKLSDIARILIPFPENRLILVEKLEAMIVAKLITTEAKNLFVDKLVTYSEFLDELRMLAEDKASLNYKRFF